MGNEPGAARAEASMPAIEFELSLRSKRKLGHILGVHGPGTQRGKQIADGFVRLVEKSILEYMACRERLLCFLREGTLDDYNRAQDHFETSAQSTHRAITYLDHLRGMGFLQADGSPFIPRARELEVLRDSVKKTIRDFRDFAEHLDQDIIGGRIPEDAEIGVHLGWEVATINGVTISYTDLVRWLGQLHHFAGLLSRVNIVVGEAPVAGTDT